MANWVAANGVYTTGNGSSAPISTAITRLFVASVSFYPPGGLGGTPISDDQGNVWSDTGVTYQNAGPSNFRGVRVFYVIDPITNAFAHTFRTNTSSYGSLAVQCFAAVSGTISLFSQVGAGFYDFGAGGTTFQPGSLSPSTPDDLFVSCLGTDTQSSQSIDSSFVVGPHDSGSSVAGGALAYKIKASDSSAENPIWTLPTANYGGVMQMVFTIGGGGGGGGNPWYAYAQQRVKTSLGRIWKKSDTLWTPDYACS